MKTLLLLLTLLLTQALRSQCDTTLPALQSFTDFATPQQLAAGGTTISGNTTVTLCYEFQRPGPYSGYFLLSYFTPTNFVNYTISVYVYDTSCTLASVGQEFLYDASYDGPYTVCFTITTWGQAPTLKVFPYFIYFTPLAATWGDLTAVQYGQGIRVAFVTLSETGSDYFNVQLSKDLVEWESFVRLEAQGNTSTLSKYETYVPYREAIKQVVYVRAQEVDVNGGTTVSDPVPVLLVIDPKVFDRFGGFDIAGRKIK
jgi:hypothetical protein